MEDSLILDLYIGRSERAIAETDIKYGSFCRHIAMNILCVREDAEECVNDTYFSAWNSIPPTVPDSLRAFLGRVTRNLSISRYRRNRAQKRYGGIELMLSELDDCVPDNQYAEALDAKALGEIISMWLGTLDDEDAALFVRRYWYGDAVKELAAEKGISPAKMAKRMFRLRQGLRVELEEKGVTV